MFEKFFLWLTRGFFGIVEGWRLDVSPAPQVPQTYIPFVGFEQFLTALDSVQCPTVYYAAPWGIESHDMIRRPEGWAVAEVGLLGVIFGAQQLEKVVGEFEDSPNIKGQWYRMLQKMYKVYVNGDIGRHETPMDVYFYITHNLL